MRGVNPTGMTSNLLSLFSSAFPILFFPAKWGYTCWEPPAMSRRISWDNIPPGVWLKRSLWQTAGVGAKPELGAG